MAVTLDLKPEIEKALLKRAKANGSGVQGYLERLVEKDINRAKTLDEILAPIRRNFAESGMTEAELDELLESERQAMWEEKHGKRR